VVKRSVLTTRTWVLLIGAALLVAAGTLNFAQRLTHIPPPTDGVVWEGTNDGLTARTIAPDSAAGRPGVLGILPGDHLVAISVDGEHYEPVSSAGHVQMYLEEAGVGGNLHYLIERLFYPKESESRFGYIELYNLQPVTNLTARDFYINFIGVVYLLVGLFVLFKKGGSAPFVLHFATLCLTAFAFHFLKPYGAYEDLDKAVAFLDAAAYVMFPPIFLHFCAIYPARRKLSERHRWLTWLVYAPGIALLVLTAVIFFVPPSLLNFSPGFIGQLYKAEFAYLALSLVAGAALLIRRFLRSETVIVRQQLKWVVWGSALAIAPFTLFYAAGYLFGGDNPANSLFSDAVHDWLTDAAILPLVLIPLTFGNSVVRYRLMDVDMVVRRAAVYVLTTLAIALGIGAVIYVAVIKASGLDLVALGEGGSGIATMQFIVAVVGMAVIVMTAAPLKNFLQERTDRFFYGERYDLRHGLMDFGRTLSATTKLDPLLDALVSRLQQVLGVERVAIFIEDARNSSEYSVARAAGLPGALIVPPDFREMIRTRAAENGVVRADDLDLQPETTGFVRRALHYYVPCVVRGRMIAVIGLGRAADGALLSSEDLEILRTVSGYVAVAIENSLLYQEQRERAAELETLKEFNESIVESVKVGLIAVDTEGRVTGCNSALEEMLGVTRDDAIGRTVEELFAEDFAETLRQVLGNNGWQIAEPRNIFKLHTATHAGRSLILNIAVAPLQRRADSSNHGGALVMLEDVTSRVRLEEQLQQREKLSSIGLLAAGVAHEINTPLTGVSSYTQMLLGMLAETDPKHALLQKIHRQTDRATGIVNNLLNFSRTGLVTDFGEVDVNRVLDDTLQLLEPQLRQSQVEVVRDYDQPAPQAYANAGKLQQVFTNLILNARDAVPDSGTVTLRTRSGEDGTILIEVADTGIGIAPENVARIYDPFFTTKGVGRGTGLGLPVTYGIVQEHSGHISVESAPGKGTTFRITLPTAHARARLQAAGD